MSAAATPVHPPLALPPVEHYRTICKLEDGFTDQYGAIATAAAYAGYSLPERYEVRGIWQHGCLGPWAATSPEPLLTNSPNCRTWPSFVARQEEEDYLRAEGLEQARAIGLPIIYTPDPQVMRQPRSLLVVPMHTLAGAEFPDRKPFEDYADRIKALEPHFDRITVCIHPNCLRNGLWVKEFEDRGIEMVTGAQNNDRHALLRMRALFEQFESVTTNGWGSHVVYALAFGAKVSIDGPELVWRKENFAKDESWAVNAEALKDALSAQTLRNRRACLKRLYRDPRDGLEDSAWGEWFIGADKKLDPAGMKIVLAQFVHELEPLWKTVQKQRQQIRAQARQLDRAGRRGEAVKLLLLMTHRASELGDRRVLIETLNEAIADLGRLDPTRAQLLRPQLDKLTRTG